MGTTRTKVFCATVARPEPSKPGQWLLMSRAGRGYAEFAHGPFPSLEAITEVYDVHIGDLGADKHSALVRMELGPAPLPAAAAVEPQAPPAPVSKATAATPVVLAYMAVADRGRRRAFDAGPFRVLVEPHEVDDAAQAAFTEALARAAAGLA